LLILGFFCCLTYDCLVLGYDQDTAVVLNLVSAVILENISTVLDNLITDPSLKNKQCNGEIL
jgi:hypothetical protein